MGYFKELDIMLQEICEATDDLAKKTKNLLELTSGMTQEETKNVMPEERKPSVTLEQLRTLLGEMARDGMTASVKSLLQRYGAEKLSQVSQSDYDQMYMDAEDMKDGR